jgi:hypothetical protein
MGTWIRKGNHYVNLDHARALYDPGNNTHLKAEFENGDCIDVFKYQAENIVNPNYSMFTHVIPNMTRECWGLFVWFDEDLKPEVNEQPVIGWGFDPEELLRVPRAICACVTDAVAEENEPDALKYRASSGHFKIYDKSLLEWFDSEEAWLNARRKKTKASRDLPPTTEA